MRARSQTCCQRAAEWPLTRPTLAVHVTHCRQGRYNLCPQMRYFGSAACSPPQDGSFREYVQVHAHNCHPFPSEMDYRQAALLEPLAIAVHGVGQAGSMAGKCAYW